MDLLLDSSGDLAIENNDYVLATGIDYIGQAMLIRFRTILTEWFLDQRIGIPYKEQILVKNPNWPFVQSIYREAALSVPGIKTITYLHFSLDAATRILSMNIRGQTEDLDTFHFTFSEMILSTYREVPE